MIYTDDLDYAAIERNAFIAGNALLAQLAADAQDRSEEVSGLEENVADLEKRLEEQKEESDNAARIRQEETEAAIEALDALLKDCKRLSNRAEIEAAVQAIYDAATGTA